MRRWPLVFAALSSLVLACSSSAPAARPAGPSRANTGAPGMLFIGNSLTEANDLPAYVQQVARDAGMTIDVDSVVAGGFSLEDHLAAGTALPRLRSRAWTVVVLQQGPSTLPESRALLIRDATTFATEIRAVGARPALLSVWPIPGQRFEDVLASYRAASQSTGAVLLPAGDAWQRALQRDQSLHFTVSDGFHPSPLGTYAAALAIHCALYGQLPPAPSLEEERRRTGSTLTAEQSVILRESACAAARAGS